MSVRSGLTVERKRLEPLLALRAATGLALVIALGLWTLGPVAAVSSAFGAFQAAIATYQRSWRPRPELAVVSGVSLAVSSFLGYLARPQLGLFVALLAVWTFLAGLTWAIGPTIGLLASTNVAIVLITVTLPTSVAQAAAHAAMMALGGLVQATLVVLFPVRRWGDRRDALADALAAEADYARRLRHDPVAPFDPRPLMEARDAAAVTPRQARRRPAELHGPRPLAERVRPVLAALADPSLGVGTEGPQRDRVRELLAAAGAVLDATAHAVRTAEPVRAPAWAVAVFRSPDTGTVLSGAARRAALRLGTLLDEMAALAETAGTGGAGSPGGSEAVGGAGGVKGSEGDRGAGGAREVAGGGGSGAGFFRRRRASGVGGESWASRVGRADRAGGASGTDSAGKAGGAGEASGTDRASGRSATSGTGGASRAGGAGDGLVRPSLAALVPVAVTAVRRELRRRSPVLRHAVRVTVVVCAGYLAGAHLPLGHGYWAPLTSVMVMRPDFSETYARAVGRFGGTLLGVALATALVRSARPGDLVLGALAVVCAGLMYLLLRTGQFAAQTCLAAYVVLLLGMGGERWTQTVPERVVLTLVGGLLAMLSYAVYPAWETPRLRYRLADWLTAVGRYAAAVLDRYAAVPDEPGRHRASGPSGQPGRTVPVESGGTGEVDGADRAGTRGGVGEPGGTGGTDASGAPGRAEGAAGDGGSVRGALLDARTARAAWQDSVARAAAEPVRHRGLAPERAEAAGEALGRVGRAAMLLEAHLPERGPDPVPGAARLAEALRTATDGAARSVRERRVPDWRPLREALAELERGTRTEAGTGTDTGAGSGRETGTGAGAPEDGATGGPGGGPEHADEVVRHGARLLRAALEDFSRALDPDAEPSAVREDG